MRSTIELSEVLDRKVRSLASEWKVSLKEAFSRIISAGIAIESSPERRRKRLKIKARECGFLPGIETDHLNRVIDELGDQEKFR